MPLITDCIYTLVNIFNVLENFVEAKNVLDDLIKVAQTKGIGPPAVALLSSVRRAYANRPVPLNFNDEQFR